MGEPAQWSVECPVCLAVLRLDRGILMLPKHQQRDAPLLRCVGEGLVGVAQPGSGVPPGMGGEDPQDDAP